MEDVFTIKVITKPDHRNLYPSERRYSASTVAGLAWVHVVLAVTCFVLACLAIVHPIGGGMFAHLSPRDAVTSTVDRIEFIENITIDSEHPSENIKINSTETFSRIANEYSCILVISPSILTVASLAAGIASVMASHRWYIDRNITWLFLMSILSTTISVLSFFMVVVWIASADGTVLSGFYTEKEPFEDFIVVPKHSIVESNGSHTIFENPIPVDGVRDHFITKRVLSVNILIACFIEFVWSLLSLKISYKGMRNKEVDGKPNPMKTVTENRIKPAPDLIKTYPAANIHNILNKDNHSDIHGDINFDYQDRMMSFLNSSFDSESNADSLPSIRSAVPEARPDPGEKSSRISTISWGDSARTIYNQNNLDLSKIIKEKIVCKTENGHKEMEVGDAETNENAAS